MKAVLDTSVVLATGLDPPVMDLLIAATAHAHNATLYTRNANDLVGIDHLVPVVSV